MTIRKKLNNIVRKTGNRIHKGLGNILTEEIKIKPLVLTSAILASASLSGCGGNEKFIQPYFGEKFAVIAEKKLPSMPIAGVEVGSRKDKTTFYTGFEYGRAEEKTPEASLRSNSYTAKAGASYRWEWLKNSDNNVTGNYVEVGGNVKVTHEENKGHVTVQTNQDTKYFYIEDSRNIPGAELTLDIGHQLSKNLSIDAKISLGENFGDDVNTQTDLSAGVGFRAGF